MIVDPIAEPFMKDKAMFAHGFTFGGHLWSPAQIAMANLDIFEREGLCEHVPAKEAELVGRSRDCETSRSSATCEARVSSRRSSS